MKYQLVLQFDASTTGDFDLLTDFEGKLEEVEGELGTVDGHDFGSGEFNVFVLTDDPLTAFKKINAIAKAAGLQPEMRAAYREIDGNKFTALWPPGLEEFTVL